MKLNFLLAFFVFLSLFYLVINQNFIDKQPKFVFCDVGQGDAFLFSQGNLQILVDTGPDKKVLTCLRENMNFWDRQIEFLVITHEDDDHYAALPDVLLSYRVNYLILPVLLEKTEQLERSFELLKQQKTKVRLPKMGEEFLFLGELKLQILGPLSENQDSLAWWRISTEEVLEDILRKKTLENCTSDCDKNEQSIVLLLSYQEVKILLTGDINQKQELALLKRGLSTTIQLLKAAHHGSKFSSCLEFLQRIAPEKIIFSCGENNKFFHPSLEVLERVQQLGLKIYRTDKEGTIKFTSNGKQIWQIK